MNDLDELVTGKGWFDVFLQAKVPKDGAGGIYPLLSCISAFQDKCWCIEGYAGMIFKGC